MIIIFTPSLYGGIGEKSMSYTDNPVRDAEYIAEIRSRTSLRKRARIAYEEIEREGDEYGRIENNSVAACLLYTSSGNDGEKLSGCGD